MTKKLIELLKRLRKDDLLHFTVSLIVAALSSMFTVTLSSPWLRVSSIW